MYYTLFLCRVKDFAKAKVRFKLMQSNGVVGKIFPVVVLAVIAVQVQGQHGVGVAPFNDDSGK
jgi:pentatricopeptide repeat protein